jgi:hypothetical protein
MAGGADEPPGTRKALRLNKEPPLPSRFQKTSALCWILETNALVRGGKGKADMDADTPPQAKSCKIAVFGT